MTDTGVYEEEFRRVACQAWSRWNRDPASPSFGSFDRNYWGWKAKDFSDASLQAAVTIAIRYAEKEGRADCLPPLLSGFVDFVAAIQHSDGSFDQCYPFERTPGVVYDILPALVVVHKSPYLGAGHASKLESVLRKGVSYALSSEELHGEVANHLASFIYALRVYEKAFGDVAAARRAREYTDRLMSGFNPREGWFQEYHGPDPGYQSRTISFLTHAAELSGDNSLWEVCAKAAAFVSELLMPDGSLHPMLGVRSTALLYPSGFERLAVHEATFRPLARRIRNAWREQRTPLPSLLDFSNAARLGEDAMFAAEVVDGAGPENDPNPVAALSDDCHFPDAGITVRRADNIHVYVAWKLGGSVVVWNRAPDGSWQLRHEDGGYLLDDGRIGWVTRVAGNGVLREETADTIALEAGFRRSLHEELTPLRLIALRLLNMTLLRSQLVGDWFRKIVVHRLSGRSDELPLRLLRKIRFGAERVAITDHIAVQDGKRFDLGKSVLKRCRRLTGNHMASARYFQPQELTNTLLPWIETVITGGAADAGLPYEGECIVEAPVTEQN